MSRARDIEGDDRADAVVPSFFAGGEFKGGEIHFFGGNCTKYSRIGGACAERSGDRIVAAGASAFRVRGREADCGYREIFGV